MMKGKSLTVVSVAMVLVAALTATWAGAQEGGEVYHACVNNASGTIHMIGPDDTCNSNEILIEWNQVGPVGSDGADGAPGADGTPGLNCWDLDGDHEPDPAEDVNLDGAFNSLDCAGAQGSQGEAGTDGAAGADGVPGLNCWDLDGDNVPDGEEDVNEDGFVDALDCAGPPGPEGPGRTINLTIDPAQFPGITSQDFDALFSDAALNSADLEVSGVCNGRVVVINGPGVEIQVVEGFDGLGRHDDQPGLSLELPFVIEVLPGSGCDVHLQWFADQYLAGLEDSRPMSLIVRGPNGHPDTGETIRWNFFEYVPTGYTDGDVGTRITFVQSLDPIGSTSPPRDLKLQRMVYNSPNGSLGTANSYNPSTDKSVEISGVSSVGQYPAVVEQTDRTLTLVYDYSEGGCLWSWVELFAEYGSELPSKRDVGVATLDESMLVLDFTAYHGCFPVKYEQFVGFAEDIQTKERVILNCDFSESPP